MLTTTSLPRSLKSHTKGSAALGISSCSATANEQEFLVGTETGFLLRYSLATSSVVFGYDKEATGSIGTISASPFIPSLFLVSRGDSVSLHHTTESKPLGVWECEGVSAVAWIPARPCAFLALDAGKRVWIYDLSVSRVFGANLDRNRGPRRLRSFRATREERVVQQAGVLRFHLAVSLCLEAQRAKPRFGTCRASLPRQAAIA